MTVHNRRPGYILLALLATGASPADPPLVVHEWGTFLSMSGSDGVTLDGMYHEEHGLPGFVHARSRDQLRIPSIRLKGETPVIYFYSEHPRSVSVTVGFPRGIWTQWYPQAAQVAPPFAPMASASDPRNGRIAWSARIVPAGTGPKAQAPPPTSAGALWNFARDVDACDVRTIDRARPGHPVETERFLFYRGLGNATLPFWFGAENGGTIELAGSGALGVRHVYVVRVEGDRGTYAYHPSIDVGERVTHAIPALAGARPLAELVSTLADDLAQRLTESGLYPKEARAMVNTWRDSYFRTEGVRVLFVLPRAWTDGCIPIRIEPAPSELVRVMVGRLELLTPEREQRAEAAIGDLAATDSARREAAFAYLRGQGRYIEPVVRRVVRTTRDESVRQRARQLLALDFVTELRAAIAGAASGSSARLAEDPVHVRAQLASLLRELGRDEEAKAESKEVLAALARRPAPAFGDEQARHDLRAQARAYEGAGDDEAAARWYESFIRFGSQVAQGGRCVSCHTEAGPRRMSDLRDWWAGARYARAQARLGRLESAIARHESTLAGQPNDVAARMMLGYLHAEQGQPAQAAAAWDPLDSESRLSRNAPLRK